MTTTVRTPALSANGPTGTELALPTDSEDGEQPSPLCSITDCSKPAHARGWCHAHYGQWYRANRPIRPPKPKRPCSIDDCDNPHIARGWCDKHYQQWWKTGDPVPKAAAQQAGKVRRFKAWLETNWSRLSPDKQAIYGDLAEACEIPADLVAAIGCKPSVEWRWRNTDRVIGPRYMDAIADFLGQSREHYAQLVPPDARERRQAEGNHARDVERFRKRFEQHPFSEGEGFGRELGRCIMEDLEGTPSDVAEATDGALTADFITMCVFEGRWPSEKNATLLESAFAPFGLPAGFLEDLIPPEGRTRRRGEGARQYWRDELKNRTKDSRRELILAGKMPGGSRESLGDRLKRGGRGAPGPHRLPARLRKVYRQAGIAALRGERVVFLCDYCRKAHSQPSRMKPFRFHRDHWLEWSRQGRPRLHKRPGPEPRWLTRAFGFYCLAVGNPQGRRSYKEIADAFNKGEYTKGKLPAEMVDEDLVRREIWNFRKLLPEWLDQLIPPPSSGRFRKLSGRLPTRVAELVAKRNRASTLRTDEEIKAFVDRLGRPVWPVADTDTEIAKRLKREFAARGLETMTEAAKAIPLPPRHADEPRVGHISVATLRGLLHSTPRRIPNEQLLALTDFLGQDSDDLRSVNTEAYRYRQSLPETHWLGEVAPTPIARDLACWIRAEGHPHLTAAAEAMPVHRRTLSRLLYEGPERLQEPVLLALVNVLGTSPEDVKEMRKQGRQEYEKRRRRELEAEISERKGGIDEEQTKHQTKMAEEQVTVLDLERELAAL